mmetsp:Transcript_93572/g.264945  ORF Transcript_93572/g.264945 Transcript_93572/m.264945 type:complete len:262 (+) Transcript_93572:440-1225(+)
MAGALDPGADQRVLRARPRRGAPGPPAERPRGEGERGPGPGPRRRPAARQELGPQRRRRRGEGRPGEPEAGPGHVPVHQPGEAARSTKGDREDLFGTRLAGHHDAHRRRGRRQPLVAEAHRRQVLHAGRLHPGQERGEGGPPDDRAHARGVLRAAPHQGCLWLRDVAPAGVEGSCRQWQAVGVDPGGRRHRGLLELRLRACPSAPVPSRRLEDVLPRVPHRPAAGEGRVVQGPPPRAAQGAVASGSLRLLDQQDSRQKAAR